MILFDFYDDHGLGAWDIPKDILEDLQTYFTQHPELLPSNLTLRLNHYEGKQVTPFPIIQGKGFIDANYEKTTGDIGKAALIGCDILTIKPKYLRTRKPLIPEDAEYTTDEETSSATPSPGLSPPKKRSNLPAHYLGSLFYDLGFTEADNDIIENACKTL
ncbi:MAG: hypothetical protein K0U37_04095 [Gammaproteobacteria bacterium]|nr:hypothetical protein [Gammaproteobacteria bacterium]